MTASLWKGRSSIILWRKIPITHADHVIFGRRQLDGSTSSWSSRNFLHFYNFPSWHSFFQITWGNVMMLINITLFIINIALIPVFFACCRHPFLIKEGFQHTGESFTAEIDFWLQCLLVKHESMKTLEHLISWVLVSIYCYSVIKVILNLGFGPTSKNYSCLFFLLVVLLIHCFAPSASCLNFQYLLIVLTYKWPGWLINEWATL